MPYEKFVKKQIDQTSCSPIGLYNSLCLYVHHFVASYSTVQRMELINCNKKAFSGC